MDKRKSILVLLTAVIAILSASVMTGAITFNPMPNLFEEFWQGSILDTTYNLTSWEIDVNGPDELNVTITGVALETDAYIFSIQIYDETASMVASSTRLIAYVADIPKIEVFSFNQTNISADFSSIDIQVKR